MKYIVKYKKNLPKDKINKKLKDNKLEKKVKFTHKKSFLIVDESDIESLKNDEDILYIEEDRKCELLLTTPNDTLFTDQWNLYNTGQFSGTAGVDIGGVRNAWDLTTGSASIIVGVVDTGVQFDHEDLADNMWINPSPTFGDVNGVRGYNNGSLDGNCGDYYGHGTHVAGIIGAKGNNNQGIAGLNWNVKIMSLRFFNEGDETYLSDAINVIEYGIDNGCHIMNHSWKTSGFSQALQDVWDDAATAGVVMVCAAGNDSKDNDLWPSYPASFANANNISVGSHSNTGENSFFSNYGIKSVDIFAPGGNARGFDDVNILSCWLDSSYVSIAGTSMACPHVTGCIALLMAYYPSFSIPNMWKLLEACITPTTYQFLTSKFGGRINLYNLLTFSNSSGTTITLDGPTDISIVPDINDPTKNNITWTDPTHVLFEKTIVTRLEWSFPDDVDPDQVSVYSGTDEEVVDVDLEQGVVYGYKFVASYADGKLSLPVYLRSRGGGEKFACPVPPTNFDFICDYWDENWGVLTSDIALNDDVLKIQAWRACMSKTRTQQRDAEYPNGLVGYYRTVKPEPPEVPTSADWHLDPVPNLEDMMSFQTIKEGAIFLESLIKKVRKLTEPVKLYSTRLSADKWFIWMDYYYYINTGKVRKYIPPKRLFDWDWEYIKLRENWYTILSTLRTILYNMRVLYTANPPYTTELTEIRIASANSDTIKSGSYEVSRTFYYPFWESPLPTEVEATPPNPPVNLDGITYNFSGIDTVYVSGEGEPHYGFNDIINSSIIEIENVPMVFPALLPLHYISLTERIYPREVWFWCDNTLSIPKTKSGIIDYYWYKDNKHIYLDWTIPAPSVLPSTSFTTGGQVAYATFSEKPNSDDPEDSSPDGYQLDSFRNNIEESISYNQTTEYNNQQKRVTFGTSGKINLSPSWDWESYPINFKIVLEFSAGGAGFTPDYPGITEDVFISPSDNTDGYVLFSYSFWDTEWDEEGNYEIVEKTGSIQLNATQLYKLYGTKKTTKEIGNLYIDNSDTLEWNFSLDSDLAIDSLPHLWKKKLVDNIKTAYLKWWTTIYEVDGSGTWNWNAIEGETPEVISHEHYFTLGRWGSIAVSIKVLPDFDYFDNVEDTKPHKVPNLIGMTVDEDEDNIVPFLDDFITTWNADADNPKIEQGLLNVQSHPDAPENRIISQSPHPDAILQYGIHDTDNKLPISIVVSVGTPSKEIDVDEEYIIPKIVGKTLEEAETYLSENYPLWSIDSDYITYHYSYNFSKDIICSQSPDWRERRTVFSKDIACSISLGVPDGKEIPNFRGQYIDDVEDELSALNCDSPSSHRVLQYHPTIPSGYIISQIPNHLPYRMFPYMLTSVGLVISAGADPNNSYKNIVPTLVGRNVNDDYVTGLIADGWDIVEIPVYCEGEEGLIVDQSPKFNNLMGTLSVNRIFVAVSYTKPLIVEESQSGVKL